MKKIFTLLTCFLLSVSCALAQLPVAAFNCNNSPICQGSCINFTNGSTNATSYLWTFSGATPSSSTDANPSNICYFNNAGAYDVRLIAYNSNGSDTITNTGC